MTKDMVAWFHAATDEDDFHGAPVPVIREVLRRHFFDEKVTFALLAEIAQWIRWQKLGAEPQYDEAWKKVRESM